MCLWVCRNITKLFQQANPTDSMIEPIFLRNSVLVMAGFLQTLYGKSKFKTCICSIHNSLHFTEIDLLVIGAIYRICSVFSSVAVKINSYQNVQNWTHHHDETFQRFNPITYSDSIAPDIIKSEIFYWKVNWLFCSWKLRKRLFERLKVWKHRSTRILNKIIAVLPLIIAIFNWVLQIEFFSHFHAYYEI